MSTDIKFGLCTPSFHLSPLLWCWALEQRIKVRGGEPRVRGGQGSLMRPVLRYLLHRQHTTNRRKYHYFTTLYLFANILSKNDQFWWWISWSIHLQFHTCLFQRLPVNGSQQCKLLSVKFSSGWEKIAPNLVISVFNKDLTFQLQIMMTSSSVLKTRRMTWVIMLSASGTYPSLSW